MLTLNLNSLSSTLPFHLNYPLFTQTQLLLPANLNYPFANTRKKTLFLTPFFHGFVNLSLLFIYLCFAFSFVSASRKLRIFQLKAGFWESIKSGYLSNFIIHSQN